MACVFRWMVLSYLLITVHKSVGGCPQSHKPPLVVAHSFGHCANRRKAGVRPRRVAEQLNKAESVEHGKKMSHQEPPHPPSPPPSLLLLKEEKPSAQKSRFPPQIKLFCGLLLKRVAGLTTHKGCKYSSIVTRSHWIRPGVFTQASHRRQERQKRRRGKRGKKWGEGGGD